MISTIILGFFLSIDSIFGGTNSSASFSPSLTASLQSFDRGCILLCIDSGLSLTTVRDATELESDRESKMNGSVILRNSKVYRSMPNRKNHRDSDSDEVFVDVRSIRPFIYLVTRSSIYSRVPLNAAIPNDGLNIDHRNEVQVTDG